MTPPAPASVVKKARLSSSMSAEEDVVIEMKSGPQRALESGNLIRDTVADLIATYGKPSLDLSVGDPTRFGGVYSVPRVFRQALANVVMEGKNDGYALSIGDESVRRAVGEKYGVSDFRKVLITSGCSHAIDLTFRALAGTGDSILVPIPGFPLYETLCKLNGINIIRYKLDPLNDWKVDVNSFASVLDKHSVKGVVVCNPSNPTGSVYEEAHLREVIKAIKQHFPQAVLIADQIYEDVVFDQKSRFVDMGPIGMELQVTTVSVSGLAKGYLCPGWRMGWIITFDRNQELDLFRKRVWNMSNTNMGATTLLQHAFKYILDNCKEELKVFREQTNAALRESCDIFVEGLSTIPGVEVSVPKGAMYIFFKLPFAHKSSKEVCVELMKAEGLLLLPGDSCFGSPPGYARAMIAVPPQVAHDALARIKRFCESHPFDH